MRVWERVGVQYWIVLWNHFTTAFTRLLRKLNSNFLHRRRKSLIRNGAWLRLIKAHHKNQNIRDKSCGKQGSSLHEICCTFLFRNWFVTQNNPIVKFNPVSSSATLIYDVSSLREHPTSPDVTTSYPAKWSPISASDWSCRDGNLLRSIVGTTQIEIVSQLPPQALRFSHRRGERETRVTGDEPQETMGRVARCLLPAFLCVLIFIERETCGYEAGNDTSSVWNICFRFSDVISRETSGGIAKCRLFSQAIV